MCSSLQSCSLPNCLLPWSPSLGTQIPEGLSTGPETTTSLSHNLLKLQFPHKKGVEANSFLSDSVKMDLTLKNVETQAKSLIQKYSEAYNVSNTKCHYLLKFLEFSHYSFLFFCPSSILLNRNMGHSLKGCVVQLSSHFYKN